MNELEKLQFELQAVNHIIESGFSDKDTQKLKSTIENLLIKELEKVAYSGETNG